MTRIALTSGTARIPPTYFLVQHARQLRDRYSFELCSGVTDIADPGIDVPVHTALTFPRSFRRREFLLPLATWPMARQLRRVSPDLLHQHFLTWSAPAASFAKKHRLPLLVTMHGADVFTLDYQGRDPRYAYHRRVVRSTASGATQLLAVSRFLADVAIARGLPADKIEVHYQGVDTDFFTPGAGFDDDRVDDRPVVLYVGALAEHKGVRDLLTASISLAEVQPHRLVLVGDGALASEVGAAAARHPHVEPVGSCDQVGVRAWMRQAAVSVLPSVRTEHWAESAGLVLLEAQACGTPVVATDSGGKPEMLMSGTTGYLVGDRRPDELSEALSRVLSLQSDERGAMSLAARDFVVRERSLAVSALRLADVYDDLLQGRGDRGSS